MIAYACSVDSKAVMRSPALRIWERQSANAISLQLFGPRYTPKSHKPASKQASTSIPLIHPQVSGAQSEVVQNLRWFWSAVAKAAHQNGKRPAALSDLFLSACMCKHTSRLFFGAFLRVGEKDDSLEKPAKHAICLLAVMLKDA